MWRSIAAVAVCAPVVGGFEIPFSRPTCSQRGQLSSSRSSINCNTENTTRFRYRRRYSTSTATAIMMAGPNKGKQPSFFADWPLLEAEIKVYLAERGAGAPGNQNEPGQRNWVLELLSVDPVKMALEDTPERDQYDGEADLLSASELFRFGYDYLVEPILRRGGYEVVSKRMGIPLNKRTLKDRQYYERRGVALSPQKPDREGFLKLGRARDERLDSIAEVGREEKKKSLFDKQAMMDKEARSKVAKQNSKPKMLNRSKTIPPPTVIMNKSKSDDTEEPFRAPGLPDELKGPRAWTPSTQGEGVSPPEPLLLNLPQRVYAVAVVACLALAYGRGTSDAVEKGFLSPDIATSAATASLFLVAMNVASAVFGASIAKSKRRSVPLWVFKGSLAGLPSVLELKGLPDIILPLESADEGEDNAA